MALITDDAKYEVSIILTLFNSKNYYLRSIDSILKQTFKNYELVIVDDGSTDNIENEIFSCLKLYKNFKYIRHSNRGHPLSLNSGIISSTAS
ncbi:MAG: glycosyltransferase family 2 protein, partial [bacterium]